MEPIGPNLAGPRRRFISVLHRMRGVDSLEEINNTFIVLIPKVASPKELGQF
jgi:hypothetical protein